MKKFIRRIFNGKHFKNGEVYIDTIIKVIICVVVGALMLNSLYITIDGIMNTATDKVDLLFNTGGIDGNIPDESPDEDEVILPYLTFQSENPFTISTTKKWDGTIEYSTDTTNWTTWEGSQLSSINGKLYFRGINNTRISATSALSYARWVITGTEVACIGNIENILDYTTVAIGEHPIMANYCYSSMFNNCTALNSAPKLPAEDLAENCYYRMFSGCTSITTTPELPAITLSKYCYSEMFAKCTLLTTIGTLPATELKDFCYSSMFLKCTSITTPPVLIATTLARNCYDGMFRDCTSLTTAPVLPATELNYYCYSSMFYGCTALETAPDLSNARISTGCYSKMFRGCTALTVAPVLPETSLGVTYCYEEMFYGCTALTVAPELPAIEISPFCYSSMFKNCTSLTILPELPATKLAESCYESMFSGCTALKISATQVDEYQYEWRIPASTAATNWNRYMFSKTSGTFINNPEVNTTYYVENPPVS